MDRIADKPIKVVLVLGERHKSLPVVFIKKLLKYAGQVQLVETGRSGKNALDLVLAHHIGEAKKADPHGFFHILSKDKDFDALIGHLKDNNVLAARRKSFSEIPMLMNTDERVGFVSTRFNPKQVTRAKKRATLESQIQAMFGKTLSGTELADTIKGLIAKKVIEIHASGEIIYKL
ncbi:MAG: hypothetical protein QOD03_1020 [Verrucomicrobiota bacterium]